MTSKVDTIYIFGKIGMMLHLQTIMSNEEGCPTAQMYAM